MANPEAAGRASHGGAIVTNAAKSWMNTPSTTWPRCRRHGRVKQIARVNGVEVCGMGARHGKKTVPICGRPIERVPHL